jgi:hypothetical protein
MAQSGSSPQPQKPPAVPIEKSVTPDYIVCLEDGKQFKSLKAASQYSRVHAGRISETVESTKGLSNGGFQILEAALSISKEHWIETERVTRKIGQIGQPGTRHRWRVAPKASNRREFGRASSRRYSLRAGQSDLARATGIGKDSVNGYMRGRSFPSLRPSTRWRRPLECQSPRPSAERTGCGHGRRAPRYRAPPGGRSSRQGVAASERQQLADKIFRLANEQADAMLDLHSGGDHAVSAHYAIFTDDGSVAGKMSRAVAAELVLHLFGTPRPYPFPVLRDVP